MKNSDLGFNRFSFCTDRLKVNHWHPNHRPQPSFNELVKLLPLILTTKVTEHLPDNWQSLEPSSDFESWLIDRLNEGVVLSVQKHSDDRLIGFVFLHESEDKKSPEMKYLHLGYLLAETHWGQGYASELIQGLIQRCKKLDDIGTIAGGVAKENKASMAVLEKNGFVRMSSSNQSSDELLFEKDF